MSSLVQIDNKKKDILLLEQQNKFYLRLHYDEVTSYILLNSVEIYKFKGKDSAINAALLCLDNVSKTFLVGNMKKTGFYAHF